VTTGGVGRPDEDGYRALRSTAAVRRLDRDVLVVSGPDAASYLQGQASQDVAALAVGASAESLLLSPQGKVEIYLRVTRTGDDRFVIDTDGGYGPVVDARLRRFKLRVKAEIEPLEWSCVAVRGPQAADVIVGRPELVVAVAWPGLAGVDLLGPAPDAGALTWVDPSAVRCGEEAWEAARIEAGAPVNGRELVEGTIAAEVGLVERTVSFTKGCFTGQELVARLDSRGSKVARTLAGVVIPTADPNDPADRPPAGATVVTADGEHEVGTVSSVAWSPSFGAAVALATIHRRVTPPEQVWVRWSTDGNQRRVAAEARPLPLIG
jgi:folate-binding protein YgfZ